MKKRLRYVFWIGVVAVGVFSLILPSRLSYADDSLNHALRGDYRASWSSTCVSATGGFDENLNAQGAVAGVVSITFAGLFHYNGDGTGTVVLKRLVPNGGTPQPVFDALGDCSLTYTVNADGTFTQTMDCTSTVLRGLTPVPQTITETGIRLDGTLGANFNRQVIILQTTDPASFTFQRVGGPTPLTLKRICGNSGSGVRIHMDGNTDD